MPSPRKRWKRSTCRVIGPENGEWALVPEDVIDNEPQEVIAKCSRERLAHGRAEQYNRWIMQFLVANGLWSEDGPIIQLHDVNWDDDTQRLLADHFSTWLNATNAILTDIDGSVCNELRTLQRFIISVLEESNYVIQKGDTGLWHVHPPQRN